MFSVNWQLNSVVLSLSDGILTGQLTYIKQYKQKMSSPHLQLNLTSTAYNSDTVINSYVAKI